MGPRAPSRGYRTPRLPQGGVRTRRGAPSRVERRRITNAVPTPLETNPRPRPLPDPTASNRTASCSSIPSSPNARLANDPPRCALEVGSGTGYVIASAAVPYARSLGWTSSCHATDVNLDAVA